MKKTFLTSLIFVAFTMIATAAKKPSFITKTQDKVFTLDFTHYMSSKKTVKILDAEKSIIFNETVSKEVKAKNYNLKNLANGTYSFIIENETKTVTQKVTITASKVEVEPTSSEVCKPSVIKKNNYWTVNALTAGLPSSVIITNENGEIIFQEKFEATTNIKRVYDVNQFPKGAYNVAIKIGDNAYYYPLNK